MASGHFVPRALSSPRVAAPASTDRDDLAVVAWAQTRARGQDACKCPAVLRLAVLISSTMSETRRPSPTVASIVLPSCSTSFRFT